MKNSRVYLGFCAALLIAIVGFFSWGRFSTNESKRVVDAQTPSVDSQADRRKISAAADSVSNVKYATLQQAIRASIAERGGADAGVASMIQIAETACSNHRADRATSNRNYWPVQYLEQSCKGFDSREFEVLDRNPKPDVIAIQKRDGAESAAEFAFNQVKSKDVDFSTKIVSGWYLIEHNVFPGQKQYKLDNESLARAFAGAVALDLCGKMRSCQSQSVMTAGLCESMSCAPGATYEDALRLKLTGAEYEAALNIKRHLESQAM